MLADIIIKMCIADLIIIGGRTAGTYFKIIGFCRRFGLRRGREVCSGIAVCIERLADIRERAVLAGDCGSKILCRTERCLYCAVCHFECVCLRQTGSRNGQGHFGIFRAVFPDSGIASAEAESAQIIQCIRQRCITCKLEEQRKNGLRFQRKVHAVVGDRCIVGFQCRGERRLVECRSVDHNIVIIRIGDRFACEMIGVHIKIGLRRAAVEQHCACKRAVNRIVGERCKIRRNGDWLIHRIAAVIRGDFERMLLCHVHGIFRSREHPFTVDRCQLRRLAVEFDPAVGRGIAVRQINVDLHADRRAAGKQLHADFRRTSGSTCDTCRKCAAEGGRSENGCRCGSSQFPRGT